MEDIIRVQDQFYVRAKSSLADQRTRVLKDADTFAAFDVFGDMQPAIGQGALGLYDDSTRFLSRLELKLGRDKPLLLSSNVQESNILLTVDMTNPDIDDGEMGRLPRGSVHIFRAAYLHQRSCFQRINVTNFSASPLRLVLVFNFESDYSDLFEVRGVTRAQRGRILEPGVGRDEVVLGYEGLDGVTRRTRLRFEPHPAEISGESVRYVFELPPRAKQSFYIQASCEIADERSQSLAFEGTLQRVDESLRVSREGDCWIVTSNEKFNELLERSRSDLHMMITQTPEGPYPYAGIPWFSTVFGRDGIITALQSMWLNPSMGRGVLSYLASTQARDFSPKQDAEPGKILHEKRNGEMVALGEVPFEKYYGSIDSTPLFVILAGAYFKRTADREFIESIWPNIERALEWIQKYGDSDGDGFVEYARKTPTGLTNQGWKDSEDSVSHSNGSLAIGPIVLCEVQGYVYRAKVEASILARELGLGERSEQLQQEAAHLRQRFEKAFWCESIGMYAIALDGEKKPCCVRSSNPGHCLYSGIVSPDYAQKITEGLLRDDMFSGWGIRTLSCDEQRYNPMSYHNGSIWPHDNAMIAAGMARYGHKDACLKVMRGLFEASEHMDLQRLPELFCGFARREGEGPTLYPVACAPQAWASGAVFMLMKASLGMTINAAKGRINFHHPRLPDFLNEVQIKNIRVGAVEVDLMLRRGEQDVSIHIQRKTGPIQMVVYH